jgi:hypothetical protein
VVHKQGSTTSNASTARARRSFDETIAEIATRQHGVVSRRQLIAAGVTPSAIRYRVGTNRLHVAHFGVYAVGHPLLSLNGRYMAAVLACGDQAVLSHRDAAALLGLLPVASGAIEVTTPKTGIRVRGVAAHRTRRLPADEQMLCKRIPCTTVARTLVDLAGALQVRRLRQAVEQSLVLRVFDQAATARALDGARGRRGTRALRDLLAQVSDEPPITNRELERRFLELVRRTGLPMPVVNGWVAGHQVDFHWPAQRLVIETDGRATHAHALAFHEDRRRDLELALAGWRVLRVTWRQAVDEPGRVTAMLRSVLV